MQRYLFLATCALLVGCTPSVSNTPSTISFELCNELGENAEVEVVNRDFDDRPIFDGDIDDGDCEDMVTRPLEDDEVEIGWQANDGPWMNEDVSDGDTVTMD